MRTVSSSSPTPPPTVGRRTRRASKRWWSTSPPIASIPPPSRLSSSTTSAISRTSSELTPSPARTVRVPPAVEPETLDRDELVLEEITEPAGHLKVRIATAEDPRAGVSAGEVRSPESLTEAYAEASAELGFVVNDLREERDLARGRLAEVRRALQLATEARGGGDIEERVRRILKVFVRAAGADGATLLLSTAETV